MTPPHATYRVQLREHLDFAAAARLAPYLARLGISHLYVSPICKAMPDSTHGYDAIDFNEIEPRWGRRLGLASRAERRGCAYVIRPHQWRNADKSWSGVLEGVCQPCAAIST